MVEELLAAGCLDRRLPVLESQLDPLLANPLAVGRLTSEEISELKRLAPKLKQACRRLDALGPPATLVHGDLHPGNAARIDGELAYFDWTDACIAHPLIDLHSLQWEDDETMRAALLDAYLAAWDGAVSGRGGRAGPNRHAAAPLGLLQHDRRERRALGARRARRDPRLSARGARARAGLVIRLDVLDAV